MKITLKRIEDGDNKVWQVRCWRNGRYDRKQFKLREDAQAYREQLENETDEAKKTEIPEEDRYVVWSAYNRAKAAGYTLVQACDLFERSLLLKVNRKPLGEAVAEFILAKQAKRLRPRSLRNLTGRLDLLKATVGESTNVHDITLADVQKCVASDWTAQTVISFRLVISNFFGWCIHRNRRYCLNNLAHDWETPYIDKEPSVILTPDEVSDMLNKAVKVAPNIVPYIAISVFAGIRYEEMSRLSWKDVDLQQRLIRMPAYKAKTRSERLVEIQPNLAKWLELGGDIPPGRLRNQWVKVRPQRYEEDAMRRTFCSYHIAKFKSASDTSVQSGHSEAVLFSRYRGLVTPESAEKFWAIVPT